MEFMELLLPHQLVLFREFLLPGPLVEWATGLLSKIQLKIQMVCIHKYIHEAHYNYIIRLWGNKRRNFSWWWLCRSRYSTLYPKNACNGCICSYPNVFFWGKHSMSMYFSCICYSVFALLLSSELLDTFLYYLYFAGYGYTGQYNNNPQQSKPELPPHYSQFN